MPMHIFKLSCTHPIPMQNPELLQKFDNFVKSLSNNDKIALFHHSDADGFCAALVVSRALEQILGKKPDFRFVIPVPGSALNAEHLSELKAKGANKLISVDLSLDQNLENLKHAEKSMELLILDHHKLYNDANSARTTLIKSQMISEIEPSHYCASKLSFDLFSRLTSLEGMAWIAAVGILGDMGREQWKDFMKQAAEKAGLTSEQLNNIKEIIDAVESMSFSGLYGLFSVFYSNKPKELLAGEYAKKVADFKKELSTYIENAKKNAEIFEEKELVFYFFESDHQIKSALINELAIEIWPKKTVVVVQDFGEGDLRISARREDFKLKVNELLENAVKGIEGARAGGHAPAAGGRIPRGTLETFKKNLLELA